MSSNGTADWNRGIIEEFRANGGKVGGYFEGAPMVLLHHIGARSGTERINPLVYLPDGDDMGNQDDPSLSDVQAHPCSGRAPRAVNQQVA